MSRVVGLDLSLTGTGVASVGEFGFDAVDTIKTPASKVKGHERLNRIVNAITGHTLGADLVVVEGPSFGSQGNALHQMGGLWWLVTQRLWQTGVPYIVATPSQVKKYLTGKGAGVDKVAMALAFQQRLGHLRIEATNDNEIDAVTLALIGRDYLGEALVEMPKEHRSVIEKIRAKEDAA